LKKWEKKKAQNLFEICVFWDLRFLCDFFVSVWWAENGSNNVIKYFYGRKGIST